MKTTSESKEKLLQVGFDLIWDSSYRPKMSERFQQIILWLMVLALAVLAGCAVGPDYKRPVVDSPGRFRDDNAATNRSFAGLNWWNVYRDDTSQALVREAFTNNYDLRIALTRAEQARQVAAQARSQFVPRDSSLFVDGVRNPEAQKWIKAAMKRGFQTRGAEMALARMLDVPL